MAGRSVALKTLFAAGHQLAGAAAISAASYLEPVLRVGDSAPGFPPGATVETIHPDRGHLRMSPAGVVIFAGRVAAPYSEDALWLGRPGDLRLVVRKTDPDLAAAHFPFTKCIVNDAFEALLEFAIPNGTSLWAWRNGDKTLLAQTGMPSWFGGNWQGSPGASSLSPNGLAIWGGLAGNTSYALLSDLRDLGAAPFTPSIYLHAPVLERPGYLWHFIGGGGAIGLLPAMRGGAAIALNTFGLDRRDALGVFSDSAATVHFVEGDPAPGFPGLSLGASTWGSLNHAGQSGVTFGLVGAGVTSSNDEVGGVLSGNVLSVLYRKGDALPGTDPSLTIRSFSPFINGAGEVAGVAQIAGPGVTQDNDLAVVVGRPGQLRRIIREGEQAPGLAPGVNIIRLAPNGGGMAINLAGRVAFIGDIPGGLFDQPEGVWVVPPGANAPQKAIAKGDSVVLPNGAAGSATSVEFPQSLSGNQDGFTTLLSDTDRILVSASITLPGAVFERGVYLLHPPCRADANGDSRVDFLDLNIVLGQYTQTGPGLPADLNHDGRVDFLDLNIVLGEFGRFC